MNIKQTLPASEVRKELFKMLEKLEKVHGYYTITQNGRPKAVMMSAEEFESWVETLEVMRDFPDLEKDIADARADYQSGDYVTFEELMAKEGFVVADKSHKTYGVSRGGAKKSGKTGKKNR